jgi:hypothetical protein
MLWPNKTKKNLTTQTHRIAISNELISPYEFIEKQHIIKKKLIRRKTEDKH